MTVTTPCKACGEPITLDRPEYLAPEYIGDLADLATDIIKKVIPAVVHDRCYDSAWSKIKYANESERLVKRANDWKTLCPPLFQDTDAKRLRQDSLARVMAWKYGSQGLVLNGATGRGKSRAAWLLLKREFEAGRFICATSHTEFTQRATLYAREQKSDGSKWIKLLSTCDLFFIDDLGKSKFTTLDGTGKAAEELLWDIMEARWTNKRPCIITTNMKGDDIVRSMSADRREPFVRRLREFQTKISF